MDFFVIVKKIIDEWDLYGLLEIHCPDDEYDSESKNIANKESPEQAPGIDEFSLMSLRMWGNKSPTPSCSAASCGVLNQKNLVKYGYYRDLYQNVYRD
jgi:hypothetical protein